ncbi:MAG: hypothetical protein NUW37_16355 [Planctomycetes bacterium]|nr:hypothetical protein [Planctomycetota bacterium]
MGFAFWRKKKLPEPEQWESPESAPESPRVYTSSDAVFVEDEGAYPKGSPFVEDEDATVESHVAADEGAFKPRGSAFADDDEDEEPSNFGRVNYRKKFEESDFTRREPREEHHEPPRERINVRDSVIVDDVSIFSAESNRLSRYADDDDDDYEEETSIESDEGFEDDFADDDDLGDVLRDVIPDLGEANYELRITNYELDKSADTDEDNYELRISNYELDKSADDEEEEKPEISNLKSEIETDVSDPGDDDDLSLDFGDDDEDILAEIEDDLSLDFGEDDGDDEDDDLPGDLFEESEESPGEGEEKLSFADNEVDLRESIEFEIAIRERGILRYPEEISEDEEPRDELRIEPSEEGSAGLDFEEDDTFPDSKEASNADFPEEQEFEADAGEKESGIDSDGPTEEFVMEEEGVFDTEISVPEDEDDLITHESGPAPRGMLVSLDEIRAKNVDTEFEGSGETEHADSTPERDDIEDETRLYEESNEPADDIEDETRLYEEPGEPAEDIADEEEFEIEGETETQNFDLGEATDEAATDSAPEDEELAGEIEFDAEPGVPADGGIFEESAEETVEDSELEFDSSADGEEANYELRIANYELDKSADDDEEEEEKSEISNLKSETDSSPSLDEFEVDFEASTELASDVGESPAAFDFDSDIEFEGEPADASPSHHVPPPVDDSKWRDEADEEIPPAIEETKPAPKPMPMLNLSVSADEVLRNLASKKLAKVEGADSSRKKLNVEISFKKPEPKPEKKTLSFDDLFAKKPAPEKPKTGALEAAALLDALAVDARNFEPKTAEERSQLRIANYELDNSAGEEEKSEISNLKSEIDNYEDLFEDEEVIVTEEEEVSVTDDENLFEDEEVNVVDDDEVAVTDDEELFENEDEAAVTEDEDDLGAMFDAEMESFDVEGGVLSVEEFMKEFDAADDLDLDLGEDNYEPKTTEEANYELRITNDELDKSADDGEEEEENDEEDDEDEELLDPSGPPAVVFDKPLDTPVEDLDFESRESGLFLGVDDLATRMESGAEFPSVSRSIEDQIDAEDEGLDVVVEVEFAKSLKSGMSARAKIFKAEGLVTHDELLANAMQQGVTANPLIVGILGSVRETEENLARRLAFEGTIPEVLASDVHPDKKALRKLTPMQAHRYRALPVYLLGDVLVVLTSGPDEGLVRELRTETRCRIKIAETDDESLTKLLCKHYPLAKQTEELAGGGRSSFSDSSGEMLDPLEDVPSSKGIAGASDGRLFDAEIESIDAGTTSLEAIGNALAGIDDDEIEETSHDHEKSERLKETSKIELNPMVDALAALDDDDDLIGRENVVGEAIDSELDEIDVSTSSLYALEGALAGLDDEDDDRIIERKAKSRDADEQVSAPSSLDALGDALAELGDDDDRAVSGKREAESKSADQHTPTAISLDALGDALAELGDDDDFIPDAPAPAPKKKEREQTAKGADGKAESLGDLLSDLDI